MDFSPEDVEHYEFLLSVPGYNRAEVRAFLQAVAAQMRQTEITHDALEHRVTSEAEFESDTRGDAERAIAELIRAAEIHIEDVANRVVGEFETVRAEISQLLRLLDQRSDQLAAAASVRENRLDQADIEEVVETEPEAQESTTSQQEAEEVAQAPEEPAEIPSEWDDLFVEPKIDSSTQKPY